MKLKQFAYLLMAINTSVYAGYGSLSNIWKKKQINVCFSKNFYPEKLCKIDIDNGFIYLTKGASAFSIPSQEEKNQIANWIKQEFSIKRTGIEFVNWGDCNSTENASYGKNDAVIFFTKIPDASHASGESHLGACIEGSLPGAIPYVHLSLSMVEAKVLTYPSSIIPTESTSLDRAMAIHEFMHLAGLHHDDLREVWGQNYGPLFMQRLTDRDIFSITSYRWIHEGIAANGGYKRFYNTSDDLYSRGDKNVGIILDQNNEEEKLILDKLKLDPPSDRVVERDPLNYRLMQTKVGLSEGDVFSLRCLHKLNLKNILKKCDNALPWVAKK